MWMLAIAAVGIGIGLAEQYNNKKTQESQSNAQTHSTEQAYAHKAALSSVEKEMAKANIENESKIAAVKMEAQGLYAKEAQRHQGIEGDLAVANAQDRENYKTSKMGLSKRAIDNIFNARTEWKYGTPAA